MIFFGFCTVIATAEETERWIREMQTATIAGARAFSFANPRNATARVFGPQLYEAPYLCSRPHLLVPQSYSVSLVQSHSTTQHQAIIARDIRPFIWCTITLDLEIFLRVQNVDEELLVAIRSDPGIWLVTCDSGDVPDDREADWAKKDSPVRNSYETLKDTPEALA